MFNIPHGITLLSFTRDISQHFGRPDASFSWFSLQDGVELRKVMNQQLANEEPGTCTGLQPKSNGLQPTFSNPKTMAGNLEAMLSNLEATAFNLEAMASNLIAMASNLLVFFGNL